MLPSTAGERRLGEEAKLFGEGMVTDPHDQLLKNIGDHHDQIAAFARENFRLDGRGLLRVEFPRLPPGVIAIVGIGEMTYTTLEEARRLLADRDDEDSAITLRMVETYDPGRQAALIAAIVGENPVTMKMRLAPPTLVDGPTSVQ
jgi:hypothetical protein